MRSGLADGEEPEGNGAEQREDSEICPLEDKRGYTMTYSFPKNMFLGKCLNLGNFWEIFGKFSGKIWGNFGRKERCDETKEFQREMRL